MADEMKVVEKLLESHPALKIYETNEGKCRVKCELTSHEMPCTLNGVQTYINGKKYKYELENKLTSKEQDLCTKYLVLKRRGQLYCALTNRHINNLPHHIRRHLNGKRFKKAFGNAENLKSMDVMFLDREKAVAQDGNNAEMWVPSESESESVENEELGSDFEVEKRDMIPVDDSEQDYSLDVLGMENGFAETNQVSDTKSKREKKGNKSRKRSGKHLEENLKKQDQLHHDHKRRKRKTEQSV